MTNENKLIGRIGERAAADLYLENDFKILVRNFYNRRGKMLGEIDFVALKNDHLHFVEIKTRTGGAYGAALEALTPRKKHRLVRTAQYFLQHLPCFHNHQAHFDLVSVALDIFDKSVRKITIHSDVIDDILS